MSLRRFDGFELNLSTGELKREGQPVALQRQPARVLTHLVARAGTLVPREELQAAVWGPDVHVDFDRGLNYCIRQLRETLQDDVREPRYIATVPRQGYRFVGVVDRPAAETPPPPMQRPSRPSAMKVAAALVAATVLALAVDIASGSNPEHHRVAVALIRAVHDAVF